MIWPVRDARSRRWKRSRKALQGPDSAYWADRTSEQILAVSAWIALAEGAKDKAVADMGRAADGEDASVKDIAMENRLYPMRELLGDLLLEAGQPTRSSARLCDGPHQHAESLSRDLRRRARRGGRRRSRRRVGLLYEARCAREERRYAAARAGDGARISRGAIGLLVATAGGPRASGVTKV